MFLSPRRIDWYATWPTWVITWPNVTLTGVVVSGGFKRSRYKNYFKSPSQYILYPLNVDIYICRITIIFIYFKLFHFSKILILKWMKWTKMKLTFFYFFSYNSIYCSVTHNTPKLKTLRQKDFFLSCLEAIQFISHSISMSHFVDLKNELHMHKLCLPSEHELAFTMRDSAHLEIRRTDISRYFATFLLEMFSSVNPSLTGVSAKRHGLGKGQKGTSNYLRN